MRRAPRDASAARTTKERTISLWQRIFGQADPKGALRPLYAAIVAKARERFWYAQGHVPDTLDGRFDMIAATLALVLLRLEGEGEAGAAPAVRLTEAFIADMDAQLREQGIGDVVVGKHVGRMVSALGGRLGAYREALTEAGDLPAALARNLWRGDPPDAARVDAVAGSLHALRDQLARVPLDQLLTGKIAP